MSDPSHSYEREAVPIARPALLWGVVAVVVALTGAAVWRLTVGP